MTSIQSLISDSSSLFGKIPFFGKAGHSSEHGHHNRSHGDAPVSAAVEDLIDLSEAARDAIRALRSLAKAQDGDDDANKLIRKQLKELRKQVALLKDLAREAATPEQQEAVRSGIENVAAELQKIGRQLRLGGPDEGDQIELSQSRTSIEAFSLKATFETVAEVTTADGQTASFRQTLTVEFSFLRASSSEKTTSIAQGEDGALEITQSSSQTELVVAELNIEQTTEAVVSLPEDQGGAVPQAGLPTPSPELTEDFGSVVQNLADLLEDFRNRISDENRIPPSLFNIMRDLLKTALGPDAKPQIDQTA